MSRLFIKNLPKNITEEKLRKIFSEFGLVTDVNIKLTQDGAQKRFAYIGYKEEESGVVALEKLNRTFIGTSRIEVAPFRTRSSNTERPWSKYSEGSSAFEQKKNEQKKMENHESKLETNTESEEAKLSDMDYLKSKVVSMEDEEDVVDDPVPFRALKLRGLPHSATKQDVIDFFAPIPIYKVVMPKSSQASCRVLVVKFPSSEDANKALEKNGANFGNRYIELMPSYPLKYRAPVNDTEDVGENPVLEDNANEPQVQPANENENLVIDTGRLFLRNLPYSCSEGDLEQLFSKFGALDEISLPVDNQTGKLMGFAFITYVLTHEALLAYKALDGTVFQGRLLHILPGKEKRENAKLKAIAESDSSTFKEKKKAKEKLSATSSHNWNTLFISSSAVADEMASRYDTTKGEILDHTASKNLPVRIALGETRLVNETKQFLVRNGVNLEAFSQSDSKRSKYVIIAKNLPAFMEESKLEKMFSKQGSVVRVIMPPSGMSALIEMNDAVEAKRAFTNLAYTRVKDSPLYLEWAPFDVFTESTGDTNVTDIQSDSAVVFVKNLNFSTGEDALRSFFEAAVKGVINTVIAKNQDGNNNKGYGFVQYESNEKAKDAIVALQHRMLDGHSVQLSLSKKPAPNIKVNKYAKEKLNKEPSCTIIVRNIPFQARRDEIASLFSAFGELRAVRLPSKPVADETGVKRHRGFGFVDFVNIDEAKRAFETLNVSTHLLGRRLVLEYANDDSESLQELRKKTAQRYFTVNTNSKPKKIRTE